MELGTWFVKTLTDLEQAVFARGGVILPILTHDSCTAILSCINNSIHLEIYLDVNGKASGSLYVDDGHSLQYQTDPNASSLVTFDFDGQDLFASVNSDYKFAES